METLRYTLIGSGTIIPSAERGPAAHLFHCGDLSILCDLGSGTLRRMDGLGYSYRDLDLVAVTHRHQDHLADLLPLLFALRNTPGLNRTEPLTLVGYPGLRGDLEALAGVFGEWVVAPGFRLEVHEAGDTPVELGRGEAVVEIQAIPVVHTPEAVGYRLDLVDGTREARVAYTGDTGECAAVVDLASDADLLVAECSTADEDAVEGHLTPRALGRIAAKAAARRLVATHFYPSALALGWAEIERRIRESYARAPIDLGVDGLEIDL